MLLVPVTITYIIHGKLKPAKCSQPPYRFRWHEQTSTILYLMQRPVQLCTWLEVPFTCTYVSASNRCPLLQATALVCTAVGIRGSTRTLATAIAPTHAMDHCIRTPTLVNASAPKCKLRQIGLIELDIAHSITMVQCSTQ